MFPSDAAVSSGTVRNPSESSPTSPSSARSPSVRDGGRDLSGDARLLAGNDPLMVRYGRRNLASMSDMTLAASVTAATLPSALAAALTFP